MQISAGKQGLSAKRHIGGITLIELMIVIVIVGILAAVGYPSYVDYSNRARRSDGKALLLDAAARMERFYFDNNAYSTDLTQLGYAAGAVLSPERNYTLGAAVGATGSINTSYLLSATPNPDGVADPGRPFSDPDCAVLSLDSRGTQTVSGTDSVADCWGR